MNAYRTNYRPSPEEGRLRVPQDCEPIPQVPYDTGDRTFGPLDALMAIAIAMGGAVVVVLATRQVPPMPAQQAVQTFPVEPLTLESIANARIEGFRAGYATAVAQGCTQPIALSRPIAGK
jgi:hypothetical protein